MANERYIKKLNGYMIKDEQARNDIVTLNENMNSIKSTVAPGGSNYGEVVLWADGNPTSEDRLHRFVTIVNDDKEVAIANPSNQIIGITSLKDDIGFLGGYTSGAENDNTKAIVTIMGVACVRTNDSSIVVDDVVMTDENGYAVKSESSLGYRVLSNNNNLLEIVLLPNVDTFQRLAVKIDYLKESVDMSTVFFGDGVDSARLPVDADLFKGHTIDHFATKTDVKGNLLKPTLETTTVNGVTCTNNGDGTYTLNGTATAQTIFEVLFSIKNIPSEYKIIGTPKGGTNSSYYATYKNNNSWLSAWDYGDGNIVNFSEINKYCIVVESGYTCNNLVFKPMITTDLTATYDDFISYEDSLVKDHDHDDRYYTESEIDMKLDSLVFKALSESAYSALETVDDNTIYFIYEG